jgi:hypothetical protein
VHGKEVCTDCRYEDNEINEYPCDDCKFGFGSVNHFEDMGECEPQ